MNNTISELPYHFQHNDAEWGFGKDWTISCREIHGLRLLLSIEISGLDLFGRDTIENPKKNVNKNLKSL